jgi:hypothetical protein
MIQFNVDVRDTFVGSLRSWRASRPRWTPSRAISIGGCCCGGGGDVDARRLRRLLLPMLRVEETLDVEVFEDTVDEDDALRPTFSIFGVPTPTPTGLSLLGYSLFPSTGVDTRCCCCTGVVSR